jgi:endonuclease YncB( thermonuclease family)
MRLAGPLLLVLLALLAVPAAADARFGSCTGKPGSPQCFVWTGKVVYVDDGDTIKVDVDGDGTQRPVRVRFAGIQAMEQTVYAARRRAGDCHAVAATVRLDKLLRQAHYRVRLTSQVPDRVNLGRPVRSVAVRIHGRWVDTGSTLMRAGLALWFPDMDDYAWNLTYHRLQQQAAVAHRGLWNDHACGAGPDAGVPLSVHVNWDGPGNDDLFPNGEWVQIDNLDPFTTVSLADWWVRDSGLRRYTFPAGAVVPPKGRVTLYVGAGTSNGASFYWGLPKSIFGPEIDDERAMGDGAYLFDPQGDLRAADVYPAL